MRIVHLSLVGLCLTLFTYFATTDLALPGPQADECVHACLAIDLMRPPHPFSRDYTFHIGTQPLPFGVDPHTGALKAYMLWPLFALFGPSVELMRLFTIFLGLVTLIFFYLFAKELFGSWTAFGGLFLLSLDSSFIFYSKLDAGPIMEQLMWLSIGALSFVKWRKNRKRIFLILGLSSGLLGLYSHIAFIWIAVASFFALWVVAREEFKHLLNHENLPWVIVFAFLSAVIFLYWLIGQYLYSPYTYFGGIGDVVTMFERLCTRGGIIPDVLLGYWSEDPLLVRLTTRPLTDIFFLGSLFFLMRYCQAKRIRWLFLFWIGGLAQMAVTPENLGIYPHRMMEFHIVLPLLSAVAVSEGWRTLIRFRQERFVKRLAASLIVVLCAVSFVGQLLLTQEAIQRVKDSGGKGFWSDAVYALTAYLQKRGEREIVCLSWEFKRILFVVTKGELPLQESIDPDEIRRGIQKGEFRKALFLLYSEPYFLYGMPLADFEEAVKTSGKRLVEESVFKQGDGRVVYFVYRIQSL